MLEFLTESDVPDSVKDVVDVIGIDAFKGLVKLAGGSLLYIPNESNLVKPIRNRMIRDEFKGSICRCPSKIQAHTGNMYICRL